MLREVARVRQIDGEPRRRWFSGEGIDLIVWLDERAAAFGFQLCYPEGGHEMALTWEAGRGFEHATVDNGDNGLRYKGTPLLKPGAPLEIKHVRLLFEAVAANLPTEIRRLVSEALSHYPQSPEIPARRPAK